MANVRVPSVQHLARNAAEDPDLVKRTLVRLQQSGPTFSYDALNSAARDMLLFRQPVRDVIEGIKRAVKRPDVRDNFLSVVPLIAQHFENEVPDFVQACERRFYPVGRDLLIPFTPPLVYSVGGKLKLPWFIFWRTNPLIRKRLSLFVTLVADMLGQDPDLEAATFEILDFSAPNKKGERILRVTDAIEIPRLCEDEKHRLVTAFAEGFRLANEELAGAPKTKPKKSQRPQPPDDHPDLFRP